MYAVSEQAVMHTAYAFLMREPKHTFIFRDFYFHQESARRSVSDQQFSLQNKHVNDSLDFTIPISTILYFFGGYYIYVAVTRGNSNYE